MKTLLTLVFLSRWSYGSYSNWPVGMTMERHQNLRANVDRLWFAGEATSAKYFGFMHGAWFEGRDAGYRISALLGDMPRVGNDTTPDGQLVRHESLHEYPPPSR